MMKILFLKSNFISFLQTNILLQKALNSNNFQWNFIFSHLFIFIFI